MHVFPDSRKVCAYNRKIEQKTRPFKEILYDRVQDTLPRHEQDAAALTETLATNMEAERNVFARQQKFYAPQPTKAE